MLGIDGRAARITWTAFLVLLLLGVLWLVRGSVLIFVVGFFFAYMLSPMVDFLERRAGPKIPRIASLGVVYVCMVALLVLLGTWFGSQLVEQATSLAKRLPDLIQRGGDLNNLPVPSWLEPYKERAITFVRQQLEGSADQMLPLVQRTFGGLASIVGGLSFVVLVPVISFLLLLDATKLREHLLGWIPSGPRREFTDELMDDLHVLLAQYIRALVILAAVTSVVYLIAFEIMRVPYAVLLAAIAAPLEFIPVIGPLIGTVAILGVAAFSGYDHIWWIVIFFAVYRLFQDYFLQPYLMSSEVELHPLVTIFGALAGNQLGGLWGMFLSIPVLASLRVLLVRMRRSQRQRRAQAETTREPAVTR